MSNQTNSQIHRIQPISRVRPSADWRYVQTPEYQADIDACVAQVHQWLALVATQQSQRHNLAVGVRTVYTRNHDMRFHVYADILRDGQGNINPLFAEWRAANEAARERGVPANFVHDRFEVDRPTAWGGPERLVVWNNATLQAPQVTANYCGSSLASSTTADLEDPSHGLISLFEVTIDMIEVSNPVDQPLSGRPREVEVHFNDNGRRRSWSFRSSESAMPVAAIVRVIEARAAVVIDRLEREVAHARGLADFDVGAHNAQQETLRACEAERIALDAEIEQAIQSINGNSEGVEIEIRHGIGERASWSSTAAIELTVRSQHNEGEATDRAVREVQRRRTMLRILRFLAARY